MKKKWLLMFMLCFLIIGSFAQSRKHRNLPHVGDATEKGYDIFSYTLSSGKSDKFFLQETVGVSMSYALIKTFVDRGKGNENSITNITIVDEILQTMVLHTNQIILL